MAKLTDAEEQVTIWDFYKPRHTHSWNMLLLSWREFEGLDPETDAPFAAEYCWENFIIRLWLYRTTVKTLTRLTIVEADARNALKSFDKTFDSRGINALKALRDMIEHFDDYAAGMGRGPALRERDLDPWRRFSKDEYERGDFCLLRTTAYEAAAALRNDARSVSDKFIRWYKTGVL